LLFWITHSLCFVVVVVVVVVVVCVTDIRLTGVLAKTLQQAIPMYKGSILVAALVVLVFVASIASKAGVDNKHIVMHDDSDIDPEAPPQQQEQTTETMCVASIDCKECRGVHVTAIGSGIL
jgi:hypothetical protein